MIFFMHLYCDFHYSFQDKLYEGKLLSKMICVLIHVDASCPYSLLSTLHSINLWSCLLSSAFAWGQARSKLWGSWYVHFASLFYIIIYCYSLIYFIFGWYTYVIFILFCMFDDYWRINCRSQDSAGKSIVKTPYFWRSSIQGNYAEAPILSDAGGSQKGRQRWATRGPHHRAARVPLTAPW